jgi:hypothetical protein
LICIDSSSSQRGRYKEESKSESSRSKSKEESKRHSRKKRRRYSSSESNKSKSSRNKSGESSFSSNSKFGSDESEFSGKYFVSKFIQKFLLSLIKIICNEFYIDSSDEQEEWKNFSIVVQHEEFHQIVETMLLRKFEELNLEETKEDEKQQSGMDIPYQINQMIKKTDNENNEIILKIQIMNTKWNQDPKFFDNFIKKLKKNVFDELKIKPEYVRLIQSELEIEEIPLNKYNRNQKNHHSKY